MDLTVIESSLRGPLIIDALKSKVQMILIFVITFSLLEWTLQIQVEILDLECEKNIPFFHLAFGQSIPLIKTVHSILLASHCRAREIHIELMI